MTNTSSNISCSNICTPKETVDQTCGCSKPKTPGKAKAAKYGAGFLTLCALCCSFPPAFIALGFMSISTGAYFSAGSNVVLVVLGALGLSYLFMQYVKRNR